MASQDWFEKDFYAILGVPADADSAAIKKAYRKLARRLHPDQRPGDKAAEKRFKEIGEAYAVLSTPEERKQYDAIRSMSHGGARFTSGTAGGEPGTTVAHRADGVVLLALLRSGQDGIRLTDLLETLLGRLVPWPLVGVQPASELAIGLLDRSRVRVGRNAEDRVEVLLEPVLARHQRLLSLPNLGTMRSPTCQT